MAVPLSTSGCRVYVQADDRGTGSVLVEEKDEDGLEQIVAIRSTYSGVADGH